MSKKLIWTNEIIEELIELLFCPSAQNLSKINAMINPLVVESLTVNNTTRRRNILSV